MKRIFAIVMVMAILILTACPVSAAEPRYKNVCDIVLIFGITDSGLAEVGVQVYGNSQLTHSDVTIYLERKVGSSWSRVNIGTEDNVWTISTTDTTFAQNFYAQLGRTGSYRAVAVFNFEGAAVETITRTATDTY